MIDVLRAAVVHEEGSLESDLGPPDERIFSFQGSCAGVRRVEGDLGGIRRRQDYSPQKIISNHFHLPMHSTHYDR
jgi:hypothetical protein